MTEQELRERIVSIAISTVWKDCYGDEVVIDRAVAEQFADALIDANIFVDIGTLKDEQQSMNGILTNMSSYMNYKLHELEHRAQVAERALKRLTHYFARDRDYYFLKNEQEKEQFEKEIFEDLINQAEDELAEEGER